MVVETLKESLNITEEEIRKNTLVDTRNGWRTSLKELIGNALIKKYNIFDKLIPNNVGYKKILNKKLQKSGCDFEVFLDDDTSIYVDLKSLIGEDYSMVETDLVDLPVKSGEKGIVVEIYQNDIFTNAGYKMTDKVLYIICDKHGIIACLCDYKEIVDISKRHKGNLAVDNGVAFRKQTGEYKWHQSNNGSGIYIKVPVREIAEQVVTISDLV